MRKIALIVFAVIIYSCTNVVFGSLRKYTNSTGQIVVYDDSCHRAWMQDMSETSMFYHKSYQEILGIVSGLNISGQEYYGLNGWHIASETDMQLLLQNQLREIPYVNFKFRVYGNTMCALAFFSKPDIASRSTHGCYFTICRLDCCEPYDALSGMPYTDLIEYPGPGNDIFIYGAPLLSECGAGETYPQGAWVVTSNVKLSDGNLVPDVKCFRLHLGGRYMYVCLYRRTIIFGSVAIALLLGGGLFLYRSKKKSKNPQK
jgi:hypothetical protein